MQRFHCFSDDILGRWDATDIAGLIRRGEVSASEIMAATLRRIDRAQPVLHGVASMDELLAMRHASAPRPGVFSGVPTLIKDNTDLKGFPTGHGSAAVQGAPAQENDVLVEQCLDQGLIAFGKSEMPEFGLNASTEHRDRPATPNPWNLDYSAGGSSGGAAALVASGALAIAHAKDGGGSIRIPAAACGLVGMKPSRERLVTYRMAKSLPVNIVGDGVLTRSVRDTANFYAGAEHSYCNNGLPVLGHVEGPGNRPLRIAFCLDSPLGGCDADSRRVVQDTLRMLSLHGHRVEEVVYPTHPGFAEDFRIYWSLFAASLRFAGSHVTRTRFDSAKLNGLTRGLARDFQLRFYRLPGALRRLRETEERLREFFRHYDALVTPVTSHVTPRLGYLDPQLAPYRELYNHLYHYVAYTPLANASGVPAISLPCGRTRTSGLPVGVQVMAGHGQERTLLELAFELEQSQNWQHLWQLSGAEVRESERMPSV